MLAAVTPLPVIGVPVALKHLDGMDSLLSIVQMPAGVPVATVAVGNARNAGLLAVRILAASDEALRARMVEFQAALRDSAHEKGKAVRGEPAAGRSVASGVLHAACRGSPGSGAASAVRRHQPGVLGGEGEQVGGLLGDHRDRLAQRRARSAVSMRASTGASPAWACCSAAVNLKLCAGTTRSSWSPVSTSVAGYAVPVAQVVQRRVGQQRLEHLRVLGRAEVGDPRRADREQVEAEHVHHAHRGQRDRGQRRAAG